MLLNSTHLGGVNTNSQSFGFWGASVTLLVLFWRTLLCTVHFSRDKPFPFEHAYTFVRWSLIRQYDVPAPLASA
jgi:hypothetical protein